MKKNATHYSFANNLKTIHPTEISSEGKLKKDKKAFRLWALMVLVLFKLVELQRYEKKGEILFGFILLSIMQVNLRRSEQTQISMYPYYT